PPPHIHTLSLHDALPISHSLHGEARRLRHGAQRCLVCARGRRIPEPERGCHYHRADEIEVARLTERAHNAVHVRRFSERLAFWRSEEHTSELQSPCNLVC